MLCVREFAQRLVALTTVSPGERSDLLRLSARFSLRDLPDFFDIAWRGDLSDIVRPPIAGLMVGPICRTLRRNMRRGGWQAAYSETIRAGRAAVILMTLDGWRRIRISHAQDRMPSCLHHKIFRPCGGRVSAEAAQASWRQIEPAPGSAELPTTRGVVSEQIRSALAGTVRPGLRSRVDPANA